MSVRDFRVTLLGFTVSDGMMKKILEKDENLPLQTHKFAWSLARAMRHGGATVQLLSTLPVSNFPKMPQLFFRGERFVEDGFFGLTLGFLNILGLKHITRGISCATVARREIIRHGTHVLVVHGVHSVFLWFAVAMRQNNRKVVIVMTDPPGVVSPSDGRLVKRLKNLDMWLVRLALRRVDGVVALTQALVEDFAPTRIGLVLPGFLDRYLENLPDNILAKNKNEVFRVAYAGGLSVAYGVDLLIDAVMGITNIPIQLDLFGKGELVSHIKTLAASDTRIRYGGSLPPADLANHLRKAHLLVNPRPSNQSFVRHSFPSKVIEYMALGVPVLSTRLPGIPDEYRAYLTIAAEETAMGFRQAILDFIKLPLEIRTMQANEARNFIMNSASESVQGKKIASFFGLLMEPNRC